MEIYARVANDALWLILTLSLLPLLSSLIVGLVISLFQALTQIQEQTLTFVPKVIVTILILTISSAWMLSVLIEFAKRIFDLIPHVGNVH